MVRVPLRELVVVLAATENAAVPLPVPLLVVVIQETLLDAVQAQVVPLAVTATLPGPPAEPYDAVDPPSE
jgi:hypothetical protein